MFSGAIGEYYIEDSGVVNSGNLEGARWTFTNIVDPTYIRSIGVIGRNNKPYQWTLFKGGDTMYGALDITDTLTGIDANFSGNVTASNLNVSNWNTAYN